MSKVLISVQILAAEVKVPHNSLFKTAAPARDNPTHSFLLNVAPSTTVNALFPLIDTRYKNDYLRQSQHNTFYIKKLQDEDGDDLDTSFAVGDLPRNANKTKVIIKVIPAAIDRDFSVPVTSSLRPAEFARPAQRPFTVRQDDCDVPSTLFHPDQPVRSTERELDDSFSPYRDRQTPHLQAHRFHGDVILDSEDERRQTASEDGVDDPVVQEEASTHDQVNRSFYAGAKRKRTLVDGSSPDHGAPFKKPQLPPFRRQLASPHAAAQGHRNSTGSSESHTRVNNNDRWRDAQSVQRQPSSDNDTPYEIPDTDNEQGFEAIPEPSSSTRSSRHTSGKLQRPKFKTYGSTRPNAMTPATRRTFADTQSQEQDLGPEFVRRITDEEKAAEAEKSRTAMEYFATASAEKAKRHTATNGDLADSPIRRPVFSASTAAHTETEGVVDGTPTPAPRHQNGSELPDNQTPPSGQVSRVPAVTSGKTPSSIAGPISNFRITLSNFAAQNAYQPRTVAGPSSETSSDRAVRNKVLPAPADTLREREAANTVPSSAVSAIVGSPGFSPILKYHACLRCKTSKTKCSAIQGPEAGQYPCVRCIKSHHDCEPQRGSGTPAPSSLRKSISASSKAKGKERAPVHTSRIIDSMRMDQDDSPDPLHVADDADAAGAKPRANIKSKSSSLSKPMVLSTKKKTAGTVLTPLPEPSRSPPKPPATSQSIGIGRSSTEDRIPPSLAEPFKTPPPETPDDRPVSQVDESSGSEGDVESSVPDGSGPVNLKQVMATEVTGADSIVNESEDDISAPSEQDEADVRIASASPADSEKKEAAGQDEDTSPVRKFVSIAKPPTRPQAIPSMSSQTNQGTPRAKESQTAGKSGNGVSSRTTGFATSQLSSKAAAASANTANCGRKSASDSDSESSSSSSSSSSSGGSSSGDDITKTSRRLAAARARKAGQPMPLQQGKSGVGKLDSVKSFISSTFGFSSSQHSGPGDEWYNVPDSPEPL